MTRARFGPAFSLTADPEWQVLLEEFFEETSVPYSHFPDEKSFLNSPKKKYSLGLVDTRLITEPRALAGYPLLKLGAGERPGLHFQGRIDKGLEAGEFTKSFLKCFPRAHETLSVLLVDDDRDFCELMKNFWESKLDPRTEVRIALNPLEALQHFPSFRPDVVVIDLKMPVLGGTEFYKKFRQKDREAAVLILSAVTDSEETAELRRTANPVCVEKSSGDSLPEVLWWRLVKLKVFGSRDLR